jgi:hypothetical protein
MYSFLFAEPPFMAASVEILSHNPKCRIVSTRTTAFVPVGKVDFADNVT